MPRTDRNERRDFTPEDLHKLAVERDALAQRLARIERVLGCEAAGDGEADDSNRSRHRRKQTAA